MGIEWTIHGAEVTLDFDLDPAAGQWSRVADGPTYTSNGYAVTFEERREADHTLVEFRLSRDSGEPFVVKQYTLEANAPAVDLEKIWTPWGIGFVIELVGLSRSPMPRPVGWLNKRASYEVVADRGMPLALATRRNASCNLALGFLDQRIETDIRHFVTTQRHTSVQEKGVTRIWLERPTPGYSLGPLTEHHDGFFVASGSHWFDTIQAFRQSHDESAKREFRPSPDTAWEPLWAPWGGPKGKWTGVHPEELEADELFEMGQVAADLGIRGFVNWLWYMDTKDDRWRGKDWYWGYPDYMGDYLPSSKLSDLRGLVRKLKSIGIMSIFWISPWMAGRQTKIREELKEALVELDMDRSDPYYERCTSYLCARNPITQRRVPELMQRVLRDYEADGFTVDMIEAAPTAPCIANHEHNFPTYGLAMADTFARMREAIDEVNPNAVIEFRPLYSNVSNLYNATAFRSPDSGEWGSFDMNRRQCVLLRSYIPPGIAVHTDPVWWHIHESNQLVAKMLSTAVVTGVPQICADLLNMTDDHRRLLKGWLSFYHEHKEDFRYGQLRPVQNDALFSTVKVERDRKAFVTYGSYPALKVPLSSEAEEIYLFNCSDDDALYTILEDVAGDFTATVHDYDLAVMSQEKLSATSGSLLVDLDVPQGGYIALTRTGP